MFYIIDAYFRWQLRLQGWLRKNVWSRPKFFTGITLATAIVLMVYFYLYTVKKWESTFTDIVSWILLIVWVIADLLYSSEKVMTSARGFLKFGVPVVLGTSIGFLAIVLFFETKVNMSSPIWMYILYLSYSLVLGIVWLLYSSFCDPKASTFANVILTGFVTLFTLTADLLTKTLLVEPDLIFVSEELLLQLEHMDLTFAQLIDAGITMLCYPLLIMLGLATIVCAIKSYWEEKYG